MTDDYQAVFDASGRPLCRLTTGEVPSTDDFSHVFARYEDELARHCRFCVLANATETTRLDLEQVKMIAAFGEKNHDELKTYVDALAVVVPSRIVRAAIMVAFGITAPPHAYRVVRTLAEAQAFLEPFLDRATQRRRPD